MHELGIASKILDIVEHAVGVTPRVKSVQLILGTLAGVSAESLEFCFTELAQQRGLGRPELVITNLPSRVRCRNCALEYETEDFTLPCSQCNSLDKQILSGFECNVDSVTVEEG